MVGDWLAQPSLGRISLGETVTRLRPQLMDLLACLAERAGQTVAKDEILDTVWPDQFIADSGLSRCVAELRQVLGDDAQDARFIETIPKRGYRLIASVRFLPTSGATLVSQDRQPSGSAAPAQAESAVEPAPRPTAPEASGGSGTAAAAGIEATGPLQAMRRILGRRRAWWISGGALVFLGASLAVWHFQFRSAITRHDTLVLAVENTTGDPVFDEAFRLALAVQLEQSPYLQVVSQQRIREELLFMNRMEDEPITRAVAMEVCQRIGAKAVLHGTLAPLGRHFLIGLEGLNCRSGDVLARHQVEVNGKEEVIAGLGRAVSDIRRRLGESVASIARNDVPLVQATTSSVEALNQLSLGELAQGRGQDEEAVRLYQRAVEIDPTFALAHVRLGVQLMSLWRYGEATSALERAYSLRDRASAAERLSITSDYYNWVARDPIKAIAALESSRDAFPRNPAPRVALARLYSQLGRTEQARSESLEAMRLDPDNATASGVAAEVYVRLDQYDAAKRLGQELITRQRENVHLRLLLSDIAFIQGDIDAMRRHLEWAAATPAAESAFLRQQGAMAMFDGKVAAGSRAWQQCALRAAERGDAALPAMMGVAEAIERALLGWTTEVEVLTDRVIEKRQTPDALVGSALALALAGRVDAAERRLGEYGKQPGLEAGSDPDYRTAARALVLAHRGQTEDALAVLLPLRPYDLASRFGFLPLYVRGLVQLRTGRPKEAIADFERITSHRGVVPSRVTYPLAWLQLARARAAVGDAAGSRQAYARCLAFWRDADSDVPAVNQARTEQARLP